MRGRPLNDVQAVRLCSQVLSMTDKAFGGYEGSVKKSMGNVGRPGADLVQWAKVEMRP